VIYADARDVLASLPDQCIDCIVTDPPYRVISGGNKSAGRPMGILGPNDGKIFNHNDIGFDEYIPELFRVLRDPGHIYIMTNLLNLWSMRDALVSAGFKIHNLLVWKKPNVTPNRWYMSNREFTLFARRGKAFTINNPGSSAVHEFANPSGNRKHPTQKPVDLMRLYVENSTQPGDLVLDPFAGSGATGEACRQTGRRFMGVEIDDKYMGN
jgi:site-specific DNA-methyltransferase (adenine-specific)